MKEPEERQRCFLVLRVIVRPVFVMRAACDQYCNSGELILHLNWHAQRVRYDLAQLACPQLEEDMTV